MDYAGQQAVGGLIARMHCPNCGGALVLDGPSSAKCTECGERFHRVDGIWRMLTEQQRARFASFLESYPLQRTREGWAREDGYYLHLPDVAHEDPTAQVWRIRRRSLRLLEAQLRRQFGAGRTGWALDLGAGNCWLARRLARLDFSTVALDLNVEGSDSLSTGQLYIEHDKMWFDRVQASMDSLPFGNEMFDLCTVSAALYYSDVRMTLREVYRALRPYGMLYISDSPVYSNSVPGVVMAKEQRMRLSRVLGHEPADLPGGQGFLVESELRTQLQETGFVVRVLSVEHPLGHVRRRIRRLLRARKREEAKFPVFVGIKPAC